MSVSLTELQEAASTDQSGTSLAELQHAASGLRGFKSALRLVNSLTAFRTVPLPAVIPLSNHDGRHHFVVARELHSDGSLSIACPANGLGRLTRSELAARWAGEMLLIQPRLPARLSRIAGTVAFCRNLLRGSQRQLACLLVNQLCISACSTGILLCVRWFLVLIQTGNPQSLLFPAVAMSTAAGMRLWLTRLQFPLLVRLRSEVGSAFLHWSRGPASPEQHSVGQHRPIRQALAAAGETVKARDALLALLSSSSDLIMLLLAIAVLLQLSPAAAILLLSGAVVMTAYRTFQKHAADDRPQPGDLAVSQFLADITVAASFYWLGIQSLAAPQSLWRLLTVIFVIAVVRQPLLRLTAAGRHVLQLVTFLKRNWQSPPRDLPPIEPFLWPDR